MSKLIDRVNWIKEFGNVYIDPELIIETLSCYPKNRWFRPKNANDFALMYELCRDHNLIAVKTMPIWISGSFKGNTILFLYNDDLMYSE